MRRERERERDRERQRERENEKREKRRNKEVKIHPLLTNKQQHTFHCCADEWLPSPGGSEPPPTGALWATGKGA